MEYAKYSKALQKFRRHSYNSQNISEQWFQVVSSGWLWALIDTKSEVVFKKLIKRSGSTPASKLTKIYLTENQNQPTLYSITIKTALEPPVSVKKSRPSSYSNPTDTYLLHLIDHIHERVRG